MFESRIVAVSIQARLRPVRVVELSSIDLLIPPLVVGLTSELECQHDTTTGTASAVNSLTYGRIVLSRSSPGTDTPRRGATPRSVTQGDHSASGTLAT